MNMEEFYKKKNVKEKIFSIAVDEATAKEISEIKKYFNFNDWIRSQLAQLITEIKKK